MVKLKFKTDPKRPYSKRTGQAITIYMRDPQVWQDAKDYAEELGLSFSNYLQQLLVQTNPRK